jgi:hypothetical protein
MYDVIDEGKGEVSHHWPRLSTLIRIFPRISYSGHMQGCYPRNYLELIVPPSHESNIVVIKSNGINLMLPFGRLGKEPHEVVTSLSARFWNIESSEALQ